MKVLLVSNAFPNSAEPVRGIFTYQIVKALQEMCDIEVVAPLPWVPPRLKRKNPKKYAHAHVPPEENFEGITVYHPRYGVIPKCFGFFHPVFLALPLLRLIKQLNSQSPIDVINAHWLFPDGAASAWVAQRLRKPIVLTALGCDLNYYPRLPFRKIIIKKALCKADAVTVKSDSLRREALALGVYGCNVHRISNGIDRERFVIMDRVEARRRLGIDGNGLFLLTVGSLDEVKGNRHLLEAIKDISVSGVDQPQLLIVGDGPLRSALLQQAKGYGIAHQIRFIGKRPHSEIPFWMNAADLFCLPSIREGRPNVLLEALACGVPVVASSVGSIPELINNQNGRLTCAGNHESLRKEILACLAQNWDRKAIRNTVNEFTWEQCATQYFRIYQKVIKNKYSEIQYF